jgi:Peptidase family C25
MNSTVPKFLLLFLFFLCSALIFAQNSQRDTLLGNEWIDFAAQHVKIPIAEDGVYRLSFQQLAKLGIPMQSIQNNTIRLFAYGKEIPAFVSTTSAPTASDYVEFYAQRNRAQLDEPLFADPNHVLNPEYSLITDTTAYFLTWGTQKATQRITNSTNSPSITNILPFCWAENTTVFNQQYDKLADNEADLIWKSSMTLGEGFASLRKPTNTADVRIENVFSTNAPNTEITIRMSVLQSGRHKIDLKLNGQLLSRDSVSGTFAKNMTYSIPTTRIATQNTFDFIGTNATLDKHQIAFIKIRYPRTLQFSGKSMAEFFIPANTAAVNLNITDFDVVGGDLVAYDVTNRLRIVPILDNNVLKIALPTSTVERKIVLVNAQKSVKNIENIEKTTFFNIENVNAAFTIITHPKFFSDGKGKNPIDEYAKYRNSTAGGGLKTFVLEVQQLYDQFGYGIQRHPLAFRHFNEFLKKKWKNAQYVLLIGKAREYRYIRQNADLKSVDNAYFTIPTFGYPGSDNLLFTNNTKNSPDFALGRLAVTNGAEIFTYLEKVKALEIQQKAPQNIDNKTWTKRILHLSGGTPDIQGIIKNYTLSLADILKNNKYGADVNVFYKTSADPIQTSQVDKIFEFVEKGTSLITFFGHSAVGTFDFSIDDPEKYVTAGKFPMMMSLGCYSGNYHTSIRGVSEKFLFTPNKGVVDFIATTGVGQISSLYQFSASLYRNAGDILYGQSIGKIVQKTIKDNDKINTYGITDLAQQFSLHGDPAIILQKHAGADFITDATSVNFLPSVVTSQMDSVTLQFSVLNIGQGVKSPLSIEISRELPTQSKEIIKSLTITAPLNKTDISVKIPVFGKNSVGFNRFYIKIDPKNAIAELPNPDAEANNDLMGTDGKAGTSLYIRDNNIQPIYPNEFSIVNDPKVTLKASTSNIFAPLQTYIMEIDTTETFKSAAKVRTTIRQIGGVVKWQPNAPFKNGTVYYWRVSPDSVANLGYNWSGSSFLYADNLGNGWNQSHFYQFQKDKYQFVELTDKRKLKYVQDVRDVKIKNVATNDITKDYTQISFNNDRLERHWGYHPTGVMIAVLDSVTLRAMENSPSGDFGSLPSYVGRNFKCFVYDTNDPKQRKSMINFLNTKVPTGNYVIATTLQWLTGGGATYAPEQWAADSLTEKSNIFSILEKEGAQQVRSLEKTGSIPYTIVYQKGRKLIAEKIAANLSEEINVSIALPGLWDRGTVQTPLVGQAKKWKNLTWQSSESTNKITNVSVFGVDNVGKEQLLLNKITNTNQDLSNISAAQYPNLRLQFYSQDSILRSAAQLNFWRVIYDGVPEAALNPSAGVEFQRDTLQQGEKFSLKMAVENISDYDMDSLLVKFEVQNAQNTNVFNVNKRFAPLLKGKIQSLDFSNDKTSTWSGKHRFTLDVNPNFAQPEQTRINNIAIREFLVDKDVKNPNLSVTFDGNKIFDGDIVSTNPQIRVDLRDENRLLLIKDTSAFKISLKYPNETKARAVPLNAAWVRFTPATSSKENKATIELSPQFLTDGTYELTVQGTDASGNKSGSLEYRITFKVIQKSMISNILNYPNPFSTSTRFVYTLTGSTQPEHFKIQILTISGKIVREITENEIGALKIGTHLTDYVWDGTDEYGGQLANGVYLYRVIVKDKTGKNWQKYETASDKLFEKGFGKMVIMR